MDPSGSGSEAPYIRESPSAETSTSRQNSPNSNQGPARRDRQKGHPVRGGLFVVAPLCDPSSSPVPLARVGPPRLRRALAQPGHWAGSSRRPGTDDGRSRPRMRSPRVNASRVRLSQEGQPQWMDSVCSHRPPLLVVSTLPRPRGVQVAHFE
jgi:hypothetical protein